MKKGILLFLLCIFSLCFFQKVNATEEVPVLEGTDMPVNTIGDIEITNQENETVKQYAVYQELQLGDKVLFEIDFNTFDPVSITVLAEGKPDNGEEENLCYERAWESWQGKTTIEFEAYREMKSFSICIDYQNTNLAERICTISNIRFAETDTLGEQAYEVQTEKEYETDEIETPEEDKSSQFSNSFWILVIIAISLGIAAIILVFIYESKRKKTRRNNRKAGH